MTAGDNSHPLQTAISGAALLMRAASTAALATFDRASGQPYVSLVTVALDVTGAPLLLVSKLARHTQNLIADPRASLLVTPQATQQVMGGDPLALARVTIMGTIAPTNSATAKACFLARHPGAAVYADFTDFTFYAVTISNAHFIGGFGRIIDIPGSDLMVRLAAQTG